MKKMIRIFTFLASIVIAKDAIKEDDPNKSVCSFTMNSKKVIENISLNSIQQKNIFLRELVANCNDAYERLRKETNNPDADVGKGIEMRLHIDEENNNSYFVIRDYGCGMDKEIIMKNLTCLGSSSSDGIADSNKENLIGKFGWGFFSVFTVGDSAKIVSRRHGTDVTYETVVTLEEDKFYIHEQVGRDFEVGTEITVYLRNKDGSDLTEETIANCVYENLIHDSRFKNYDIKIIKSENQIEMEKIEEQERVSNEKKKLESKIETAIKNKEQEEENLEKAEAAHAKYLEDEQKQNEGDVDDNKDVNNDEKGEAPYVSKVEEIRKKIETHVSELSKYDAEKENLVEKEISPVKILDLCPWPLKPTEETFKSIFESRYKKKNLFVGEYSKFSFAQGGGKNTVPVEFEALVFIPKVEDNMFSAQDDKMEDGKLEVFVQGSKINIPIKSEFLAPFTFIVKSNEAKLSSNREIFLDHENTVNSLKNRLIKLVVDVFTKKMTDNEIHKYSKIIKSGYFEHKKAEMEDIKSKTGKSSVGSTLDKLCNIITFQYNDGVASLKNFVDVLNKVNEIHKKKNIAAEKVNEDDEKKEENEEEVLEEEEKTEKELAEEKKLGKYGYSDSIYYTNISNSLVKNIKNPLFDGVDVPFLILDDIHDEQILGSLKDFKGFKIKNINTKKFEHKPEIIGEEKLKYDEVIEFLKDTLKTYIGDVVLSRRLQELPFSIISHENSMSQGLRSVIGENKLDSNPFRSMFDPKPTLEINVDSDEINSLMESLSKLKRKEGNESESKSEESTKNKILYDESEGRNVETLQNGIKALFVATSIACRVDLYEKSNGFIDLLNIGRSTLGVDKKTENIASSNSGMDMFGSEFGGNKFDMGMDGMEDRNMDMDDDEFYNNMDGNDNEEGELSQDDIEENKETIKDLENEENMDDFENEDKSTTETDCKENYEEEDDLGKTVNDEKIFAEKAANIPREEL